MDREKGDERFAWRAALAVMLFFSSLALVLRAIGLFPFQDVFAIFLVGIPTVVLFIGWVATLRKGSRI